MYLLRWSTSYGAIRINTLRNTLGRPRGRHWLAWDNLYSSVYQTCLLIYHAVQNIQHDNEIMQLTIGIYIMVFSLVATGLLIMFQRYVYKKTASLAISSPTCQICYPMRW